jgi:hypothetical protein
MDELERIEKIIIELKNNNKEIRKNGINNFFFILRNYKNKKTKNFQQKQIIKFNQLKELNRKRMNLVKKLFDIFEKSSISLKLLQKIGLIIHIVPNIIFKNYWNVFKIILMNKNYFKELKKIHEKYKFEDTSFYKKIKVIDNKNKEILNGNLRF